MNITHTTPAGRTLKLVMHASGTVYYPLAIRGHLTLGQLERPAANGRAWTVIHPDHRANVRRTRKEALDLLVADYESTHGPLPETDLAALVPVTGVPGTETVKKAETRLVPYFGRRCYMTTYLHTTRTHGLRTVVMHWDEDADERNGGHPAGTVVTEVMNGDGRRPGFEMLFQEVTPPVL